jgi:L-amino acid N-acyltransferase YncA
VPTVEEMADRIIDAGVMHEWLVLEVDGEVTGYAYAHQFNSRAAYQWSVETSVYLAQDRRRAGGGRMLYAELLRRLTERGFRRAGHYRRVGWKLGAWHDVQWWQLDLLGPDDEADPPRPIAT